jgi:hypothetical protein
MAMLARDKQAWLQGIQLAPKSQMAATPWHQQQQQLVTNFFHTNGDWCCPPNELHA